MVMGNNQGTNNSQATSVQGLYFDNGTKNVLVDSNTVAYIANNALHGNNCSNLVITNNLFFAMAGPLRCKDLPGQRLSAKSP
jgi:hypothetical protein